MKILILGAGQVGSTAAYHLSREEANEVTVVDMRPEMLRELLYRLEIRTVVGHAAYPEVLERAGANDADIVVALTDMDETNMVACQVMYTLFRTPTRIARLRSDELTLLLPGLRRPGDALEVGRRMLQLLDEPFTV